jgi:hypothetical protein
MGTQHFIASFVDMESKHCAARSRGDCDATINPRIERSVTVVDGLSHDPHYRAVSYCVRSQDFPKRGVERRADVELCHVSGQDAWCCVQWLFGKEFGRRTMKCKECKPPENKFRKR